MFTGKIVLRFSGAYKEVEMLFEREDVDVLLQKSSFSGVLCSSIIRLLKLKCSETIL